MGNYVSPTRRKKRERLQRQCDKWNAKNPIGTLVKFWPLFVGTGTWETRTTSSVATVLGNHSAVVTLKGLGDIALDHCEPYAPVPDFKKLMKGAD